MLYNMNSRLENKNRAIQLRRQGFSYREIMEKLGVSKGTLSSWFKYIRFSEDEERLIQSRAAELSGIGLSRTIASNMQRRMVREKEADAEAGRIFSNLKSDPLFLIGIALYWAEGSKRDTQFNFVNSDPDMIDFMFKWMLKYLGIQRDEIRVRLFIHKIPGYEDAISFWSKRLYLEPYKFSKTIYKKTAHTIKKNPNYRGCVRLGISKIYYLRLMMAWQKLLLKYYMIV